MDNLFISKLENGLSIIVDHMPCVESVFVGLWMAIGSCNEKEGRGGLSHFLEHMAFKGTASRTYKDIAEQVEDIGGDLNAYTSKNRTFYFIRTLKEHLDFDIGLLGDIVFDSTFDEAEVEKEKQVVLQEYLSGQDDPDDLVGDCFYEAAFQNAPLGRPIIGVPDTIRAIDSAALKSYVAENYRAGCACLIVSGNAGPEEVMALAGKYLSRVPPGKISAPPSRYRGGSGIIRKDLEQISVMIGFEASPAVNRRAAIAEALVAMILGGGMSSRLFQVVRERDNLVYGIGMATDAYADSGAGYIWGATEPAKIEEMLKRSAGEVAAFASGGATSRELDRAKEVYRSALLFSLESASARARQIGKYWQFHGRPLSMKSTIAMLDSLSREDIMAAAAKMFSTPVSVAAVGRTNDMPGPGDIAAMFKK
ncbi:MAG: insulinase family protein [Rickettsiales bacterium]|jgi:predicted Zn-dependent peptidase|nr:insulinase family protein [Rickettsiales bacterium]